MMIQKRAVFLFGVFWLLVVVDLLLFVLFEDYRNQLGTFDNYDINSYIYRLLPDLVMLLCYSVFLLRYSKLGIVSRNFVFVHSAIFFLLGAGLCIPWGGIFFAPLTPICVLFLGSVLWIPEGFYVSTTVAMGFLFLNGYLLINRKRI